MRTRKEIEQDGTRLDILQLEVLLDCRDALLELAKSQGFYPLKKKGHPACDKGGELDYR